MLIGAEIPNLGVRLVPSYPHLRLASCPHLSGPTWRRRRMRTSMHFAGPTSKVKGPTPLADPTKFQPSRARPTPPVRPSDG